MSITMHEKYLIVQILISDQTGVLVPQEQGVPLQNPLFGN